MPKLTSINCKKATIIVALDDGRHIMASTKDQFVFNVLASFCTFSLIDESMVDEIPISEIIKKGK